MLARTMTWLWLTLWLGATSISGAAPSSATTEPTAVGAGLPYAPKSRPQPDEIVHVPTGLGLSFETMMEMVAGARLVFIGESHDNYRAHEVQLQVFRPEIQAIPLQRALAAGVQLKDMVAGLVSTYVL